MIVYRGTFLTLTSSKSCKSHDFDIKISPTQELDNEEKNCPRYFHKTFFILKLWIFLFYKKIVGKIFFVIKLSWYKNYPIIKIRSLINPNKRFSFCRVSYDEILKQIGNLDTKKQHSKMMSHLFLFKFLQKKNVNQWIKNTKFPSDLKVADVTPC